MATSAIVKILIRDDDIFLTESPRSGQFYYDFDRFVKVHTMIRSYGHKHGIAIIASEIQNYPKLKKYIQANLKDFVFGVHGWAHHDYSTWPQKEIKDSLGRAKGHINDVFGIQSEVFFPPWNRLSPAIYGACSELKLRVDDSWTDAQGVLNGTDKKSLCFHYWNDKEVELLEQCLKKNLL